MSIFNTYLLAIISYWWAFMMGVPFILDETVKWLWPKGKAWLDQNLSKERRRPFEIALMLFGVFLAGFLAFKDEHEARLSAEKTLANVSLTAPAPSKYRWQPLSSEESGALRVAVRGLPGAQPGKIICSDNDCRELMESLVAVFEGAGWSTVAEPGPHFDVPKGIELWQKDAADRRLADAIQDATKGRLVVAVHELTDGQRPILAIGFKP